MYQVPRYTRMCYNIAKDTPLPLWFRLLSVAGYAIAVLVAIPVIIAAITVISYVSIWLAHTTLHALFGVL